MPNAFQEEITGLLLAWGNGDRDALDRLVSLLAGVSTPTIEREWRAARLWRDHALATGAGR